MGLPEGVIDGQDECRAGACPHDVAIPEVLRTRMYATDYEDLAYAREDYAKLGGGAGACESCTHQACLGSCPYYPTYTALACDAHIVGKVLWKFTKA